MKLAVFPGDDIEAYVKKGEIRKNYFNPNNMFSEIIIFNFSKKKNLDKKLVQFMCGTAEYKIHFLNETINQSTILKLNSVSKSTTQIIMKETPDVIRSYGVLFNSYVAAKISKKLNIPFVLSLHDNYNGIRHISFKSRQVKQFVFWTFWKPFEKYILNSANIILPVYGYALKYALDKGIPKSKTKVVYNRVDPAFKPDSKVKKLKKFTVLNIMRQNWMKNQKVLIQAIAELKDVDLILIGNGPQHTNLQKLAKELGVQKRVTFITSVMNYELPKYYQKCHCFVSPIYQGGVGIPDLEALSSGLPLIHVKYWDEPKPDVLMENAIRPNNTAKDIAKAIKKLKDNIDIQKKYSKKGIAFSKKVNFKTMSDREEKVYKALVSN